MKPFGWPGGWIPGILPVDMLFDRLRNSCYIDMFLL